jgi:hypothetical protein
VARLAVLVALFLVAAPAASAVYQPFRTPSGNIGCYYSTGPAFLRCDTAYDTSFTGKRSCPNGDYGRAFGMSPRGHARALCVGDTALNRQAPAIAYGHSKRFGPYSCTSRTSGLTCHNRAGHGWTLSRQRQRLF